MKPAEIERIKELLPTTLGSDEIRAKVAADILRRSIYSARMASAMYLAKVRDVCEQISSGAINQADARAQLLAVLDQMGHSPQDGGGLKNPASIRRLNLIVDTQRQMAASVARIMNETEGTRHAWPAWELTRISPRMVPRIDWHKRWQLASSSVDHVGVARTTRMVALKDSPVWQALGDGTGGFKDTLKNPYPPFAYSSGMGWVAVDREDCIRLGLNPQPETGNPKPETNNPQPSLSPSEADIRDTIERYGFDNIMEGLE